MTGEVKPMDEATLAEKTYKLEALRTRVSAALSIMIVGGVIAAQFVQVSASEAMIGWGGAVVGFWLGARSGSAVGISPSNSGQGKF